MIEICLHIVLRQIYLVAVKALIDFMKYYTK